MMTWLLHALLVGGLAAMAAHCADHALRSAGLQTRYAWLASTVMMLVVPFIPRATTTPLARVVLGPIDVVPTAIAALGRSDTAWLSSGQTLWLLLSIGCALILVTSCVKLARERARWQPRRLHGHDVLISDRYGPAVVPFFRPPIVVPTWALSASENDQKLIVTHELEHVRAHDALLVLFSRLAVVLMPWNPFVWLQTARLRFAIEADCDQRVLRAAHDPATYAALLVAVGGRSSDIRVAAALAERRSGLERRVIMVMSGIKRGRLRAALFGILGVALVIIACESRAPTDASVKAGSASMTKQSEPTFAAYTTAPSLSNRDEVGRALVRSYPPELRDAGIGGQAILWLLVDTDGAVINIRVKDSSGRPALDEAAQRVARDMTFTPALEGTRPVRVWIAVPVVFRVQ